MSIEKANFIIKDYSLDDFVKLIKQLGYRVDPNYKFVDSIFSFDKKKNLFVQRKNLIANNFIEVGIDGLMERVVSSNKLNSVYMFLFKTTDIGIEYIVDKLKINGNFDAQLFPNSNNWTIGYNHNEKCFLHITYNVCDNIYGVHYYDNRHSYKINYEVYDVVDTDIISKYIEMFKKLMNNDQNRKHYE